MKGIILAGGTGTRLYPLTKVINKHLLPVYDKPMIFYSLSLFNQCNIKDVLLICNSNDLINYKSLLGDGNEIGLNISYMTQKHPKGIADAFIIGETFIGNDSVALILGDNYLYGDHLTHILQELSTLKKGGVVFGCQTDNPCDFAVAEVDNSGRIVSLQEKPKNPKSKTAIPGIYFYDNTVVDKAKRIKPSNRGELEITDINKLFLIENSLSLVRLDNKTIWWDLGTIDALMSASEWVNNYQKENHKTIGITLNK